MALPISYRGNEPNGERYIDHKDQFQNQSPGGEPFQLGGANGLCFQLLWTVHLLTINGLASLLGAGDATIKAGQRQGICWVFIFIFLIKLIREGKIFFLSSLGV